MNESAVKSATPWFHEMPSLITLCNAFCGFASIVLAIMSYAQGAPIPHACIWLLLGALIFDTLDGLVARQLNVTSIHGAQLDSLSDAISFGAAPAVSIFVFISRGSSGTAIETAFIWAASLFYLGCTLWRLARYNMLAELKLKEDGWFEGLPSPAAACMIYSAGLLLPKLALGPHLFFFFSTGYAYLTGLLMVSTIPYPHVRRCVSRKQRLLSVVFVCIVLGSIVIFHTTALIIWAYLYFLIAPLAKLLLKKPDGEST